MGPGQSTARGRAGGLGDGAEAQLARQSDGGGVCRKRCRAAGVSPPHGSFPWAGRGNMRMCRNLWSINL